MGVVRLVDAGAIDSNEYRAFFSFAGIKDFTPTSEEIAIAQTLGGEDPVINNQSGFSYFTQISTVTTDLSGKIVPVLDDNFEIYNNIDFTTLSVDSDMIYYNSFKELPLYPSDYYWGKFTNAVAGVNQINNIPILNPGKRIATIGDRYIDVKTY
jgi:hypothetical protein